MGSPTPYVLARSSARVDEQFAGLADLATRLEEISGNWELELRFACVARGRQPSGAAIRVTINWSREFLGYCFLPRMFDARDDQFLVERLAHVLRERRAKREADAMVRLARPHRRGSAA